MILNNPLNTTKTNPLFLRVPAPSRLCGAHFPKMKAFLSVLTLALAAASPAAEPLRVYHFGNSLTGGAMPAWHGELGKSAGKTWENHAWLGAGWQLWQHREEIGAGKDLFSAGSKGDLTLDANLIQSAGEHVKAFHGGKWDSIVLQLFAPYLTEVTASKWGKKLSGEKDCGDLGAATDLIRLQLARNPATKVFIYQVWPPMDAGQVPPQDQLPDWARRMEKLRAAEFPDRGAFDYAARWTQPYDAATSPQAKTGFPWRSRAFSEQVFTGLKDRFPELWKSNRLRLIPAGELFFELDRQFRAGKAPGVADIRDFYTDVQHIRAGLPRYAVAALMFACLFEESPAKLDWQIYNDAAKYGPDPHHDAGAVLPINAGNARLVHETITALLARQPRP
jgi:hypothetical protein